MVSRMNKTNGNKIFSKIFYSYLMVLLILTTTFVMLFQYNNSVEINNTMKSISSQTGSELVDKINNLVYNLLNINVNISRNNTLSPKNTYDPVTAREKCGELSEYNNLINTYRIALYSYEDDIVYASNATSKTDAFFNNAYKLENFTSTEIKELVLNPTETINVYNVGQTQYYNLNLGNLVWITMPYTYNYSYSDSSGVVIFMMQEKDFIPENNSHLPYDSHYIVTNPNSQTVYSNFPNIDENLLEQIESSKDSTFAYQSLNGEQYMVSKHTDDLFTFYSFNKWIGGTSEDLYHQLLIYGIISVILFLLILTILYITKRNYRPIKDFMQKTSETFSQTPLNDFSDVSKFITTLAEERNKFEKDYNRRQEEKFINNCIHGNFDNFTEDKNRFCEILNRKYYAIMIIYSAVLCHNNGYSVIKKYFSDFKTGVYVPSGEGAIIAILATDEERVIRRRLIESAHDNLNKVYFDVAIAVSNFVNDYVLLSDEYSKALNSIEYTFVYGNERVIYYNDILDVDDYPVASFDKFFQKIVQDIIKNDINAICNSLYETLLYIRELNLSLSSHKKLCFDLINEITTATNKISENRKLDYKLTINNLIDYDSISKLFDIIAMELIKFCDCVTTQKNQTSDKVLVEKIKEFIEINCLKYEFSLNEIAEHFSVNLPYLCKIFRENTGETVLNYATSVKIEYAKTVLVNSDLSINELAEKLGYASTSSFIRRFKQIVSLTPTDYRKIHCNFS